MAKLRGVVRSTRFDEDLNRHLETAVRIGGFASCSAFIRAAVHREVAARQQARDDSEKVVASLDRVAREFRSFRLRQQAEFAFLDSLVKILLTHLPELPRDAYDYAVARAKGRYDRFLKTVGMGMAGDSEAAMKELLRRVDEE